MDDEKAPVKGKMAQRKANQQKMTLHIPLALLIS